MATKACRIHKIVADVAPLSGGEVLLVKYADVRRYDNQRGWFLPDDYLNFGEHPLDAARRILREQVGIDASDLRLSHVESFGNGAWHLIFHFTVELETASPPFRGSNVEEAQWFPLAALPEPGNVAHGGWAIDVLREILGRS